MRVKDLILLFLFLSVISFSQNKKVDSLIALTQNSAQDSGLVKTWFRLGREYYLEKDYNNYFIALKKARFIASKINFKRGVLLALEPLAINYQALMSLPDSSLKYCELLAEAGIKYGDWKKAWVAHLVSTDAYNARGSFASSAEAAIRALDLSEKNHFDEGRAMAHKALGVANAYLSDYSTAVKEYNRSRDIYLTMGDTASADDLFFVLGIAYGQLKDRERSLECFLKGLALCKKINDVDGIHRLNNEIAGLYSDKGEPAKALQYVLDSYKYFKSVNDKEAIANSCIKIAGYMSVLKLTKERLPYIREIYNISLETNNALQRTAAMQNFASYYEDTGDYKTACLYHKRFQALRDSIFQSKFTEQVAEMGQKYESEKKDKELLKKESEIKIQQADASKKSTQRNFFIAGFGLMFVSTFLVLRGYSQKKKANAEISEQKLIIEEKQKEILDSIHYARRIQATLMASKDFMDEHLSESFVLFKPKDIVSGDFYWAAYHKDKFFLAVCDSTGHGVPGAFMSLLSIGFMAEAIKEKDITDPNLVFNYVRKRLVDSISKDGQQDGFDGVLLCFDKKTKEVTYAAANNAPVLVSKGQLYHLKCDKMPVGKGEKQEPFQLYSAGVNKGDILYCYTDGYADQFGGPKGKKFKYKQLDELLTGGAQQPLSGQAEELEKKFMAWKGELEQVDDVCIIGVRI